MLIILSLLASTGNNARVSFLVHQITHMERNMKCRQIYSVVILPSVHAVFSLVLPVVQLLTAIQFFNAQLQFQLLTVIQFFNAQLRFQLSTAIPTFNCDLTFNTQVRSQLSIAIRLFMQLYAVQTGNALQCYTARVQIFL